MLTNTRFTIELHMVNCSTQFAPYIRWAIDIIKVNTNRLYREKSHRNDILVVLKEIFDLRSLMFYGYGGSLDIINHVYIAMWFR